jgi:prepilin-type N-terminal cleavage/methylation domain-containing protein
MPRPSPHPGTRGFSLIEAIAVVAIVGILAAGVAPAIRSQTRLHQAAAAAEAGRLLRLARAHAMATGEPTGVEVFSPEQTIRLVVSPDPGQGVITLSDALGQETELIDIPAKFPGAAILGVTGGDGSTQRVTLWFSHAGEPQVRSESGSLISSFAEDAVIQFQGEHAVAVLAVSGVIE